MTEFLNQIRETQDAPTVKPIKCRRHPNYTGLRKLRNACDICQAVYDYNRAYGIREKRNPMGPRVGTVYAEDREETLARRDN